MHYTEQNGFNRNVKWSSAVLSTLTVYWVHSRHGPPCRINICISNKQKVLSPAYANIVANWETSL